MSLWTQQTIQVKHPYPGPASFADTDADRAMFYGRKREAEELFNRVLSSDFAVLFGRSGVGKSSLINAGLMKPLRDSGYLPVVCRLAHADQSGPLKIIRACVLQECLRTGVDAHQLREADCLWEFFFYTEFSKDGQPLRPVLIIDQFEDLFTGIMSEPDWGKRWGKDFVEQLADLVRHRLPASLKAAYLMQIDALPQGSPDRQQMVQVVYEGGGPDVRVLAAIREDFLAKLELLRSSIPTIFRNTLCLEPLTTEQASEAIQRPGEQAALVGQSAFSFEPAVIKQMLEFLSTDSRTGKSLAGACIEPTQLQILCLDLNERRLLKGASIITDQDLGGKRAMRWIIRRFYTRILAHFPRVRLGWSARKYWPSMTNAVLFHRPRRAIRKMCEYGLITATGYRDSLILDVIQRRFGVAGKDLDELVNLRLLRDEPRLGTTFYELAHDTLLEAIREARRWRRRLRQGLVVGVFLVPLASVTVFIGVSDLTSFRRDQETIQNSKATPEQKSDALKRFLTQHNRKDFTGLNLLLVNLSGTGGVGLSFSRSDLSKAKFQYVAYEQADFSHADLTNADFGNSVLWEANFRQAQLSGASFAEADIRNTDFREARLAGASFYLANLENVNLAGVDIDKTRFDNTNWWMAKGLSDGQLRSLSRKYGNPMFVQSENFYSRRVEELSKQLSDAGNSTTQAQDLNEIAWYRAVSGKDLLSAMREINLALEKEPDNANCLDTRGYIRLQLEQYPEALSDMQAAIKFSASDTSLGDYNRGALHYHLALVYERLGQMDAATLAFAEAEKLDYEPTYERIFTPRRL